MKFAPLNRTSFWVVLAYFISGTAIGFIFQILLIRLGWPLISGNYLIIALLVVLALYVLYRGLKVKRFLDGKLPDLSPFYASTTYIFAKSSIVTGWFLAGLYSGGIFVLALQDSLNYLNYYWLINTLSAASALLLGILGLISESYCKAPPPPSANPA
ncbi:MAG: DUF3180 family protein [Bifidobacteriaceae bacterium]|jgi:uncharacterized membrane protein|nr:DUF3180 family protein [Bifidobacteriaceae bacterium]